MSRNRCGRWPGTSNLTRARPVRSPLTSGRRELADDSPKGEVVGDGDGGRDDVGAVGGQGDHIGGGLRTWDQVVARACRCPAHAGLRAAASAARRKASSRSAAGQPVSVAIRQAPTGEVEVELVLGLLE